MKLRIGTADTLDMEWDPQRDILVLVGDGGPALARKLLEQGQRRIIVYCSTPPGEPGEVVVVTSTQELRLALLGFPGLAAGRAGLHRLPSATITPREIELVQDVIDEVAQSLGTQLNTIDRFGESWILQGIANTPAVASWPSIDALREPFRGRPCVIVSPGPSLTRNIEQVLSA